MRSLLFFTILFTVLQSTFASEISKNTAQLIAKNFYNTISSNKIEINDIQSIEFTHSTFESPYLYLFNVSSNNGFVIISKNDIIDPILGYATSGHISFEHPLSIPKGFIKLLNSFQKKIHTAINSNTPQDDKTKLKWSNLLSNNFTPERAASVAPLIQTTWAQGQYYNDKCPSNSLAGCVAINLAQIIKYHQHPTQGIGYKSYNHFQYGTISENFSEASYNYSNMPPLLNASSSQNHIDEVSKLIYHAGVAVEMKYSPTGSSSHTGKAKDAFIDHFGYDENTIQMISRSNFTSTQAWVDILKQELDANRPIYYSGFCNNPSGGHAFTIDGYDPSNFFHINWGWDGDFNGYFQIDNLNPSIYNWSEAHRAIIGIQPHIIPSYDIHMNSSMNSTPTPIEFAEPFLIDVYVQSSTSTSSDFMLLIFNEDDVIMDTVGIELNQNLTANSNYNVVFYNNGVNIFPGQYKLGLYYRINNGDWTLVDQQNFQNPQNINVTGGHPSLALNSNITITPNSTQQNQPFSISANIINTGNVDFYGDISADVYTLDGYYIDELDIYQNETIEAGLSYNYTFYSTGLDELPGSYKIVLWCYDSSWEVLASGNYSNFKTFNLSGIDFLNNPIDQYETNNTWFNPYVFRDTSFHFDLNNQAILTTNGANIHNEEDIDHYQLDLPVGYNYEILVYVNDSYNDSLFRFSNDVMIKGLNNQTNVTDPYYYDEMIAHAFHVQNGGKITVQVMSYFEWEIGSYELVFDIHRTATSNIQELTDEHKIHFYPNPSSDFIYLNKLAKNIRIRDIQGKDILSIFNNKSQKIDISTLNPGTYVIEMNYDSISQKSRLIKN